VNSKYENSNNLKPGLF